MAKLRQYFDYFLHYITFVAGINFLFTMYLFASSDFRNLYIFAVIVLGIVLIILPIVDLIRPAFRKNHPFLSRVLSVLTTFVAILGTVMMALLYNLFSSSGTEVFYDFFKLLFFGPLFHFFK